MVNSAHNPARILVAEDDAAFREAICQILRKSGYLVKEVDSGETALSSVGEEMPDLIILDLHFSGIDGFRVCELIRENFPTALLPIIVLSGDGTLGESRVKGLQAGAYDFLAKPVRKDELLAKVEAFLKMRRIHDSVESQRRDLLSENRKQEYTIENQRLQVEQLKRFFSPQVADVILRSNSDIMKHHKSNVTVCFTDLRGFTAFAENSEPAAVIELISEYYRIVCGLALSYGGTISSLAGDGIMVIFNDPVPIERHVESALNFLFHVRSELGKGPGNWLMKNYPLGFGAGLASGESIIGAIGFDQFVHYTAISRTVNLAARLCKEARVGQILATKRGLGQVMEMIDSETVGAFELKGIHMPVTAINAIGWKTPSLK